MKPTTTEAMTTLLNQINKALPFGMAEAEICAGKCIGCPKKLMEYMSMEVDYWQCRLEQNDAPDLAEFTNFANRSKRIYKSLSKNGLVNH